MPSLSGFRNIIFYKIPPFLYAGFIYYLSLLPSDKLDFIKDISDLLLHFIEYALFEFFILRFLESCKRLGPFEYILSVLFAVLYGVADEFHQSFVPGRYTSLLDIIADTLGAAAVAGIYYFLKRIKSVGSRCGKTGAGS